VLAGAASPAGAQTQERLSDQLRKGIVQEETGQNIDKAIQAYQAIVAQFDQDRRTAATALFRLAECYRKLGKREQAVAGYQRVVREFADQAALVDSSRKQLTGTFGVPEPRPTSNSPESAQLRLELAAAQKAAEYARQSEANARKALENARLREVTPETLVRAEGAPTPEAARRELVLAETQIAEMRKKIEAGLMAPSDLQPLMLQYEALRERYMEALKQRDDQQVEAERARLLVESMLKSIEAEMALLQQNIQGFEKKIAVGTASADSAELLQLRRDLIALQRKADEIRIQLGTSPKR
jgi:tetratricopeptide (TPR) repeat protein